ncbi:MAG: D-alanine-D-alanine ligase-like protein [Candidatus Uhrbacteria bacterium GW2011_GWF2_44_350]|uniref:D-alanine-D-alanine ligase-like protein n=1 Tax=Candidatus Uhrbacteria bacterium GW2011_GWF2_44_350 TaxID=1619000 RepID=A0A0G1LND6_9BACT|nr:MAG: D-alanine-D-alanine ligase-like protein [Candidatus Uhrbacteria bacterium GW2011_GWF2_44_350]
MLLVNTGSPDVTGNEHKKFIYKKIAETGVNIIALNEEANLKNKCVKHWILSDLSNHDKTIKNVEAFLRKKNLKLDGAITFLEDSVLLTSKITDYFKLPGVEYQKADLIRNKYRLRSFCEEHGLPTPKFCKIKKPEDIETVTNKLSFPVVVKPIYGASSAFVVKAENKEELLETYQYIKNNISKKTESALGQGFTLMVEEYIDGDEVDVNVLIQNGRVKFFNITDNYQTKEPFFIETGMAEPSALPEEEQQALIDMVEEVLDLLGVQNACLQFEAKSTSNGPVPLEINLRMGGDEAYFFAKSAWGVDLIEGALKIAAGVHLQKFDKPDLPKTYLAGETLHAPYSGVVSKIEIEKQILKQKFVENIEIFKEVGDSILTPPFGYEYLGWVSASGDNPVDADENLQQLLKAVEYSIIKFEETSFVGKTVRKNPNDNAVFSKHNLIGNEKIKKIRALPTAEKRKLHIGVVGNDYTSTVGASVIEKDLSDIGSQVVKTLKELGYKVSYFDFNNIQKAQTELYKSNVDMVFNVCERVNNTSLLEPHAAGVFDILQIPYTGSNPFTLGLCIDKIKVKKLLSYHNIPTPAWDYVYDVEDEIDKSLTFPLIVKPANTDHSIGIDNNSVVTNQKQLKERVAYVIKELGSPALIEEYIEGDEYDVFIIGNGKADIKVLPLSRTIFSALPKNRWHIKTLESKFGLDQVYKKYVTTQIPPKKVDPKLVSLLSEIALDTYNILDCHDYGRIEIRVDRNNNPYVLELNPNPSINASEIVDLSIPGNHFTYGEFLEEIIKVTMKRYKNSPPYFHLQSNIL